MRTFLIAGNWKMHKTLPEARALVAGIRDGLARLRETHGQEEATPGSQEHCSQSSGTKSGVSGDVPRVEVLICPPYPLLFPMAKAVAGTAIMLGAQNAHEESQGAFTGEVSVPMLKETGCTHVIIGHSERRQHFGERNDRLARKVRAVTGAGLTVIYCVGETLQEREGGRTELVVRQQIDEVLGRGIPVERLVVAYEPVWAIGTGRTATPEQAQEVHSIIRSRLGSIYDGQLAGTVQILYGGSVKAGNAGGLLAQQDIDGALVGGACLVPEEFVGIIAAGLVVKRS